MQTTEQEKEDFGKLNDQQKEENKRDAAHVSYPTEKWDGRKHFY